VAIQLGQTAVKTFTVTDGDTAIAMGSGDVPVLGTPRMIAWCEEVTLEAIAGDLEDGATTVGYQIYVDHLAPTPVGEGVEVIAVVESVDGRQVTFAVKAMAGDDLAAKGKVVRMVVDRDRFLGKIPEP